LCREDLATPSAQRLISALNAELSLRYPEQGANHFRLEQHEVAPGQGAFLVAYSHGEPVACGAIRLLEAATFEIKRMFVVPEVRGRGVSRLILNALEAEAKRLGANRLVLETGTRQLAAISLYRSAGFEPVLRFGEYVGKPLSLCMAKELSSQAS
jgi:putative acetyltransferase